MELLRLHEAARLVGSVPGAQAMDLKRQAQIGED
jgi:hypothetical protein